MLGCTESTAADEVDAEDSGCRFYSYRGEVEYLPPGGGESDWQFARLGVKILVGTRIRTAEESTAILQFADLSTMVLKPETEVLIKAMPKRTSNFELVTGKIWVNIKRILKGESLEVRTFRADTIPWGDLAFESTGEALRAYFGRRDSGLGILDSGLTRT